MKISCVYKPTIHDRDGKEKFEAIQKHFGWSDAITEIKIGTWQGVNNTTEFPTIEEMKQYEKQTNKEKAKSTGYTQEMISIRNQAIANGTFMKAPNGNPTNLTERQWLQVRTKAFKDWFGDWLKHDKINPYNTYVEIVGPFENYDSADVDGIGVEFALKYNGEIIGEIPINAYFRKNGIEPWGENEQGIISASSVGMDINLDAEYRGKGLGKAMYFAFAQKMADLGYTFASSVLGNTSEDAKRVWDSLVRDGYAYKKNDRYYINNSSLNNASKVVDENGEPLVVYHGGAKNINIFKHSSKGYYHTLNDGTKVLDDTERAIFFSNREDVGKFYSGLFGAREYDKILKSFRERLNTIFYNDKEAISKPVNTINDNDIKELHKICNDIYKLNLKEFKDISRQLRNDIFEYENGKSYQFAKGNVGFLRQEVYITLQKLSNVFNETLSNSYIGTNELNKEDNIYKLQQGKAEVYAAFLNIKNPSVVDYKGEFLNGTSNLSERYSLQTEKAFNNGNDGVIYKNIKDPYLADNYGVFNPNQIKSATDNVTFSRENNDIYKSQEKISNGVQNTTLQAMLGTEIEKEISLNEIIDTFLIGSPYEALIKTYRDDIALKDVKVNLTRDTNGGKYDSGLRRITLGANTFFNNGSPASIMMHEIMHALTVDRINKYPEYKERFKAILDEYRKKNDVFAHQYYNDAHTHKTFDEDTAIKEFIADCWTNPRTIKELDNIVADKKTNRTLWDKIKSLFNDIFKAKEGSLLETAAVGITELLNETLTSRDFTDHDTYRSQEILGPETKINIYAGTGENVELSNFAERPFEFTEEEAYAFIQEILQDDEARETIEQELATRRFDSVEQAFQYFKSIVAEKWHEYEDDYDKAEEAHKIGQDILNNKNGTFIKKKGRSIPMSKYAIEDWNGSSSIIMYNLIKQSFRYNPQARQKLFETGYATLTHTQDKGKWGNEFPRILMEVRSELMKEFEYNPYQLRLFENYEQPQQEQKINTHQESTPVDLSLDHKMRQTWTPQVIQNRGIRISQIFKDIVTDLENKLPEIEKLNTSSATRKYIITVKNGTGNILSKVKDTIKQHYANVDWVTEQMHNIYDESDWDSQEVKDKIDYIVNQGNLMLEFFEPLCYVASSEIKRQEGVSILTGDGEVIDLSEEENFTDEEIQQKHEEGWYYNPNEQSVEETLRSETVSMLSNLYEVDSDGQYVKFDDLEEPLPIDFRMALATLLKTVGNCNYDTQMLPALQLASQKYPWMKQIIDNLLGRDTATSSLYDGLSEEDRRLKAFSLQATFWRDMHKILVNISEQKRVEDKNNPNKTNVECGVINRNEGADALMKIFEDVCYNNKTLFNEHGKPYKSVYNSDGTFNNNVYNQIHKEVNESGLYYRIPDMKVDANDVDLIDRTLKSFGINISKENISKLFDTTQEITDKQKESAKALKDVVFGFYAPNKDSNSPLKTVIADNGVSNIFDEFNKNYKTISEIFSDESIGFEESQVRITVDNENKSLFSRIFPNLTNTIVNKLKNTDNLSDEEYQARLQADYGKNWWFAPTVVNGKGIFRKGILKDLSENPAYRIGLRVTSLKASDEISYLHEIDAQAEETRLNQFENSNTPINGINFREYSVPTFSDAPESYFMRLPYFDIHDSKQRTELLDRLCDVARQEIDRINVVKARARMNEEAVQKGIEPPVKEIAGFDKYGDKFSFIPGLNENKDEFIEEFNRLNVNPEEQQRFLKSKIRECLEKEFDFYVDSFNSWQVTKLPTSRFKEKLDERKFIISFIDQTLDLRKNIPLSSTAITIIDNIKNKLLNNTFTDNQFNELKEELKSVITSGLAENEWSRQVKEKIDSCKIDTSVTERLKDYFYNTFYAETQIISLTMRDPAFLGTLDKFQKRYKMFYSPVETCYTCEYYYDEDGNIALRDEKDSLGKQTEYSLVLQDDALNEAFSFDNIKAAINQKVLGGYLTKPQADEILYNFSALYAKSKGRKDWEDFKIIRSDAQCYRTLPSWQACLNMIGKGFDKKMQQSMNRLMNPDKYGQWSYEDYHNVWEIFKPFVASYAEKPSMVDTETEFNSQFENIETPIMHKNSEFLLLAMYSAMSGELQNNWKLKALNEFMVKHGIDKVQFESAVKVGIQSPININDCTTPEEVTSTLEAMTGLRDNMQASEGDKQVITAIPFSSWGISTSMPEHLLEHEESSMGTQLMKIIMEGISEDPNKEVKVGDRTMTYKQWLELYQAIHVQNIKDDFAKVGKIFDDNNELATYLKKQILTQNKYSHDLIRHLELDANGNFINPIIDPMLRGQFDALLASLVRNRVTKRMTRLGALPQVASYGFDDLQLRFKDENGNLMLTQKEFKEDGSNIDGITTWDEYKKYINSHDLTIAHMEVLLPPFDNNFMANINDVFIDKNGKFNHKLFMQKIDKKLLEGIANRIPTETKHSMIPIYIKGFLPSQNSSCVVCPAEWIAISDSDNDGDKLYTYFYHSRVVWDTKLMKEDWAKHYKWNYINRTERERLVNEAHKYAIGKQKVSSSDIKKYESEDYKKSENLDIMFDQLSRLTGEKDLTQTLVSSSYDTENNKFDIHAITTFDTKSDREYDALKEFLRQAKLQARYIKTIEPIEFKTSEVERHEDESDSEYNHRVLMESIKDNTHEARNNMMLDLMNSILKTDENTAQILIPGGFPIIKSVSDKMKKLTGVKDDACSICNPAVRTQQQVNNTAGKNLVGVYANHRSLRPLLEMADITVNTNNRITINGNISLPKKDGLPTFSLSNIKNARNEYISDNVSNFSGASVDNAKDPRLKHLGQDEVSAPITMFLIHQGYTIEEAAMFMCQPSVKQCIRQHIINGRKGSLLNIVLTEIEALKAQTENRTIGNDALENLPLSTLEDQIERDAKGIIQNADDCAIQQVVLESLAKIIPASQALQSIISVVKSDTQIGALSPRSAENKIKLQMIDRLVSRIDSDSFPLKGAKTLIPDLYTSTDVDNSDIPYVSAFRFFGVESIRDLSKELSMTFTRLVDDVHDTALEKTDELNLDANTIDGLTNATASYLFSSIKQFDNKNTSKIIRRATRILNEIKQRRLIKDNALINDLTVNVNGNRYSKRMPFIKLNRNNRKNIRGVEVYQNAWRSLIVNGANEIKLNDGTTITYKELSDMLFDYCFVVHGLTPGGNSFMYCYPTSELDKIEGYVDMVNRLSSYNRDSSVAENIVDQYVANNPQNYHLVHKINGKNFNIKDFLTKSRVVPQTIKVTNFKDTEEFYKIEVFGGQVIYKPYPYITFKDETGRRYLYKGSDMDGGIMYQRMQVLGNTESGYLEEYVLGGNVMFGFDGCINSALLENSNMIVDAKLKNDLDANIQERVSRGETLTQEDYLNTIRILLGGNEVKEKSIDDYTAQTKDKTGMEFCAIL